MLSIHGIGTFRMDQPNEQILRVLRDTWKTKKWSSPRTPFSHSFVKRSHLQEIKHIISNAFFSASKKYSNVLLSGTTRLESDRCSNQMKVFLKTTKLYNYKWIVPNILKVREIPGLPGVPRQSFLFHNLSSISFQASTCFHLLYFTILRLNDIQKRLLKKQGKSSEGGCSSISSCSCNSNSSICSSSGSRPIFLVLLYLVAVALSCINIFVEEVRSMFKVNFILFDAVIGTEWVFDKVKG